MPGIFSPLPDRAAPQRHQHPERPQQQPERSPGSGDPTSSSKIPLPGRRPAGEGKAPPNGTQECSRANRSTRLFSMAICLRYFVGQDGLPTTFIPIRPRTPARFALRERPKPNPANPLCTVDSPGSGPVANSGKPEERELAVTDVDTLCP